MMRRIGCLMALLLIGVVGLSAQNLFFEAGGGIASHYGGTRSIGAFRIGLSYEYELGLHWSVKPGLMYYAKGWKDKNKEVLVYDDDGNVQLDEDGKEIKGVMNVTSNTNYIELPILVNYNISLAGYNDLLLSAGPYIAYGIGGKAKTYGDTEQSGAARYYYSHSTFDQDDMHRFDAGITAGATLLFNEHYCIGVLGDFGLTNVTTGGSKNLALIVTLAYKF